MGIRIGQGYDSHGLVEGIPFYLGGIHIESSFGAKGHSDGDCLLHALTDSLLGALALGDIGQWFPDTAPELKGIRSTELLKNVLTSEKIPDFKWLNLDMTVFLNQPKLKHYREPILNKLSELLEIERGCLNIKAKTWEGLGVESVVSASVTCLIEL